MRNGRNLLYYPACDTNWNGWGVRQWFLARLIGWAAIAIARQGALQHSGL